MIEKVIKKILNYIYSLITKYSLNTFNNNINIFVFFNILFSNLLHILFSVFNSHSAPHLQLKISKLYATSAEFRLIMSIFISGRILITRSSIGQITEYLLW